MSGQSGIFNYLLNQIGWGLFHFTWQASLIAIGCGLILLVLPKKQPNLRYWLCLINLVAMIILPIVTVMSSNYAPIEGTLITRQTTIAPVRSNDVAWDDEPIGIQYRRSQTPISQKNIFMAYTSFYLPYITSAWLLGVLVFSIYHLLGFARLKRLISSKNVLTNKNLEKIVFDVSQRLQIQRRIKIFQSERIQMPAVMGWLKPVLLVPASFFMGLDQKYIESILIHELAHIRRHDYLANMIQVVIETLGFFHPAVWWLSNHIRREREHCCDNYAVRLTGDKLVYVKALVHLEEIKSRQSLVVAANGSDLTERVTRILDHRQKRQLPGPALILIFLPGLFIFGGFSGFFPVNGGRSLNPAATEENLRKNLIAYYPFNGNADDESGNGHHGLVEGAALANDRNGIAASAYDFDGEDDFIEVQTTDALNITGSLTICSWICPRSCEDYDAWVAKSNFANKRSQWRAGFGEDENREWGFTEFTHIYKNAWWFDYWVTESELPFNAWSHVAVVYNQETALVALYKNGSKVGEFENLDLLIGSEAPLYIGHQKDDHNRFFDGKIDEVRIYNCALGEEEIFAIYHMDE